jgi:hypothetical protein
MMLLVVLPAGMAVGAQSEPKTDPRMAKTSRKCPREFGESPSPDSGDLASARYVVDVFRKLDVRSRAQLADRPR